MSRTAVKRKTDSYGRYIGDLRRYCRIQGLSLSKIGVAGYRGEYNLFKVTAGRRIRPRAVVCFVAGIHGDETSGPWAALEIIRRFDWSSLRRTKVVILPLCNPWGFANHRRTNAHGADLNRRFLEPRLPRETRALYAAAKKERPAVFASFHEDDESEGFYMFAYNRKGRETGLHRVILKCVRPQAPISRFRSTEKYDTRRGLIFNFEDSSFEHRMWHDGVPECLCMEAPDRLPLKQRVALNLAAMEAIIARYERT
jgi:murein peptide amidase A